MALPLKSVVVKRTCVPVCGLIRQIAGLKSPATWKKASVPWYKVLEESDKSLKARKKRGERRSILRDPGVVIVDNLNREELCQHLAQNVVYRKGPLLAINKPPGLSVAANAEAEICLESLLPDLQQLLEIKPELHVVKTAPKQSSGLTLLSNCHVTTKHLEDFYSRIRKAKKPFMTFWAVTLGVPDPAEGDIKVVMKEEQIKDLKMVVPVIDPSKGSLQRKEVKETQTFYKVLDSADGCSVLQLQPVTVFRDHLLVQCTLKFCPVLGDHTYSARVAKTLGHNIYVPFDLALPQTQRVEEKILQKMHFSSQQMHRMPLHLHLHQLMMPTDPRGRYPAYLQAPPPLFFQRTMQLLGLKVQD